MFYVDFFIFSILKKTVTISLPPLLGLFSESLLHHNRVFIFSLVQILWKIKKSLHLKKLQYKKMLLEPENSVQLFLFQYFQNCWINGQNCWINGQKPLFWNFRISGFSILIGIFCYPYRCILKKLFICLH